jgi:uncharacterized repeat protein (TIGR01451 family)
MISPHAISNNHAHNKFLFLMSVAFLLFAVLTAPSANAQSTTTLFAGTQDFNQFGLADVTLPGSGLILAGTASNPTTGLPVRHLWYGDEDDGICRLDPDVDSSGTIPGPGLGSHSVNIATCVGFPIATPAAFRAAQMAFDPATNTIYATDVGPSNQGLLRLHYIPNGDNGQGMIDPVNMELLVSPVTSVVACPPPNDPILGSQGTQADAVALGPDGNVYLGYKRGGHVVRVLNPATLNPSVNGACQSNVQVPIIGPDEATNTQGHNFGMAWIGHTLFAGDNISPWELTNADQCLTAANGNVRCGPSGVNAPIQILASFVTGVQGGVAGDGNNLYFATLGSITRVANAGNPATLAVTTNYGGSFCFISGIAADAADPQGAIYVGVDCAQGGVNGDAAIYKVVPAPAPAIDLALSMSGPFSVNANSTATYTLTVINNGSQSVPQAVVNDTLPTNAALSSFAPSQGSCSVQAGSLVCNLGAVAPGALATVTVLLSIGTTAVTNSATATELDANGNQLTDATPANNTASVTTSINPPPVSTDIQVVGSAQNGGPNVGSADTYTWQIKNNQGTVTAPNVVFTNTLPSNLQFTSASSTIGSCTGPAHGSAGGTVTCSASSLPGGQTMVVTINVVVTQAATIATTGSAAFQGTDTNPNNNSFTVTIKSK